MDNHKKDRIVLISSIFLTFVIAAGGFLFTRSSFYLNIQANDTAPKTNALRSLAEDIKTSIIPPVKDIQENIDTVSKEYKKGTFKDFFVPKSE